MPTAGELPAQYLRPAESTAAASDGGALTGVHAVDPRGTRWDRNVKVLYGASGFSIRSSSASAPASAMVRVGWCIVVRSNAGHAPIAMSSYPTIHKSSGTATFTARAASSAPNAIRSLLQKIAVGRSGDSRSLLVAV